MTSAVLRSCVLALLSTLAFCVACFSAGDDDDDDASGASGAAGSSMAGSAGSGGAHASGGVSAGGSTGGAVSGGSSSVGGSSVGGSSAGEGGAPGGCTGEVVAVVYGQSTSSCGIDVPGVDDPSLVNVVFSATPGQRQELCRMASSQGCDLDAGWWWTSEEVALCDETCGLLDNAPPAQIIVEYGCPSLSCY